MWVTGSHPAAGSPPHCGADAAPATGRVAFALADGSEVELLRVGQLTPTVMSERLLWVTENPGAQGLLTLGDAGTATLFIGASILVSISFGPILLSATPAPAAKVAKPMSLRKLLFKLQSICLF